MTSPYWTHELLLWLQMLIPDAVVGPALLSMHKVRVRVRVRVTLTLTLTLTLANPNRGTRRRAPLLGVGVS